MKYTKVKTERQLYYYKDREISIMILIKFRSHCNAMTLEIRTKDNLWWKFLGEILKGVFVTVEI